MTDLSFLRRAPRVLAIALTAGILLGAPPAASQEPGDIVQWEDLVEMLVLKSPTVLPTIAFEFDSDRLTPVSQAQIAHLARALKIPAFRRYVFSVEGHTDSAGGAAYNECLSLRRARRVARSLVAEHGVPPEILTVCGRGESIPREGLAPENNLNRRVEVLWLEGAVANLLAFGSPADPLSPDDSPVVCWGRPRGSL